MKKVNRYSKIAFSFAILFWLPAFNIFTSAFAIAFGNAALNEIKEGKGKGKGLAIASITLGIITIILSVVGFISYNLWLKHI